MHGRCCFELFGAGRTLCVAYAICVFCVVVGDARATCDAGIVLMSALFRVVWCRLCLLFCLRKWRCLHCLVNGAVCIVWLISPLQQPGDAGIVSGVCTVSICFVQCRFFTFQSYTNCCSRAIPAVVQLLRFRCSTASASISRHGDFMCELANGCCRW